MINALRHIIVFLVQFFGAAAVTTVICAGVTLHRMGMAYSHTPEFAEKLHEYMRAGLAVGAIFCLILFCYHLTRPTLEGPDPPSGWGDN